MVDAHTYNVIGHISQVIDLNKTNLPKLLDNCKPLDDEDITLKQVTADHCLQNLKSNSFINQWECQVKIGPRSFHVIIDDMHKTTMPMSLSEGDVYLKNGIPGKSTTVNCQNWRCKVFTFHSLDVTSLNSPAQSIYIITDVLKAGSITAVMIDNTDKMEKIQIGSRPIAFGYSKFSIGPKWVVAEQVRPSCFLLLSLFLILMFDIRRKQSPLTTESGRWLCTEFHITSIIYREDDYLISNWIESRAVLH